MDAFVHPPSGPLFHVRSKQWMNYLTNLTYTYNSSTTQWVISQSLHFICILQPEKTSTSCLTSTCIDMGTAFKQAWLASSTCSRTTAPGELTKLRGREGGAGAVRAILPSVGHLQLISTLIIGADSCQLCQYKLT